MAETILSRTPVAKVPQTLGSSIKGIFLGFILIPLALWLCYYGETRKELSAYVKRTVAIEPASAPSGPAQVRFSGLPEAEVVRDTAYGVGNAWYINRQVDVYKQVEKTRRVKRDGQEYDEKYLVEEWVYDPDDSQTITTQALRFGLISVIPRQAEWLESTTDNILMPETRLGRNRSGPPSLGDQRVTITGIKAGTPLFVAGHLDHGMVSANENGMMVVSARSEAATIASLESTDRVIYWVIKGVAFFLLYGGFMVLLGPVTWALSWIPILGHLGRGLIGFGMFVFSAVLIGAMTLLIQFFWWVVGGLVLTLVLIVLLAVTLAKKKGVAQ